MSAFGLITTTFLVLLAPSLEQPRRSWIGDSSRRGNIYKHQTNYADYLAGAEAVKNRDLGKLFPGLFHTKPNLDKLLREYSQRLPTNDTDGSRKKRMYVMYIN